MEEQTFFLHQVALLIAALLYLDGFVTGSDFSSSNSSLSFKLKSKAGFEEERIIIVVHQ